MKMLKNYTSNIKISQSAKDAINHIEATGFEAWIVGGFVRDYIINQKNKHTYNNDIDITTNATPQKIEDIFKSANWITYPLGKKFGTIGVKKSADDTTIEITTYRTEASYSDGRHPDNVQFAENIDDDLMRRDFTCNAIAYNPNIGVYDPYNGIGDIERGVICCVGKPEERFSEDKLRILRAIRFASQLGFKIDDATAKATHKMKDQIASVSAERIREEMTKLLCGKNAKNVLDEYRDVLFEVIPQMRPLNNFDQKTKYHSYDAYTHTLITLDKMSNSDIGKWAALLHDIGKPDKFFVDDNGQGHFYGHPKRSAEISKDILKSLKFSKKMQDTILLLIRWHDQPMEATKKSVKKMLRKFAAVNTQLPTDELFRIYCDLRRADSYAHAENYREYLTFTDKIEQVFDEVIAEQEAFSLKDLAISGHDVIELGVKPGPQISQILNECLNQVVDEKIANKKHDLLILAKSLM